MYPPIRIVQTHIAAINQAVVKQREQINQNQEATQEERDNALNELKPSI